MAASERAAIVSKGQDGSISVVWAALTGDNDDFGQPVSIGAVSGLCFQVSGTLGGDGAVAIQGSNDGVTYYLLKDEAGNDMAFSALGLKGPVTMRPLYIRPLLTEGEPAVTSLVVTAAGQRGA